MRWIAPTAGVYRVTARATNTVSTATGHADVFVGGVATVVINQAGAVTLQANGSDIFFLRTANNITLGAEVFSVTGGVATDAIDLPTSLDGAIGDFIAYAPDRAFEVHSIDTVGTGAQTPAVHLYLGDFATKDCRRISEEGQASGFRYPGFTGPDVAPDSRYIAYTGMFPTPLAAGSPAAHEAPEPTERPDVHHGPRVVHNPIGRDDLDSDAVKIVQRLTRFDHAAYLVGGCVRDLLLGRH